MEERVPRIVINQLEEWVGAIDSENTPMQDVVVNIDSIERRHEQESDCIDQRAADHNDPSCLAFRDRRDVIAQPVQYPQASKCEDQLQVWAETLMGQQDSIQMWLTVQLEEIGRDDERYQINDQTYQSKDNQSEGR